MDEEEMKIAFGMFDENGDGSIDKNELKSVLNALGKNTSDEEIEEMMKEIDIDKSGKLEFDEFKKLMNFQGDEDYSQEDLLEAFETFDENGDGRISPKELKKAMMSYGEKLTNEEAEDLVNLSDTDGDGLIDYKEFVLLMKSK